MISWLNNWANQIILSVIIATILEMILPYGKNKKYIKMVIGIYILFNIIQPIITKLTGDNLDSLEFDYKKYFDSSLEVFSSDFEEDNSKLIEQTYITNIKNDITAKIEQKGYIINTCELEMENKDNYQSIKNIKLIVRKKEEKNNDNINEIKTNNIQVEEIKINSNNNIDGKEKKDNTLTKEEKDILINFIADQYSITDKKNIQIN